MPVLFLLCKIANTLFWKINDLKPTDVGRIVSRFLAQHFTQYVDYGFTAQLEDELDAISRGEKNGYRY